MQSLLAKIKQCKLCENNLALGANPIVAANAKSKIAIIGQAPGLRVHTTHIPWNDKSGHQLRSWLQVDEAQFYNPSLFALVPMGLCYPGKGKSGDLPPRPECAPAWHEKIFEKLTHLRLIILIGKYSQDYYLKTLSKENLTETVKNYKSYLPKYFPLPHPSPRNNIWLAKNEWFRNEVLSELQTTIKKILDS